MIVETKSNIEVRSVLRDQITYAHLKFRGGYFGRGVEMKSTEKTRNLE